MSTKTREPTVVAATSVLKTEARKRHIEVDDMCRVTSKINMRKNLIPQNKKIRKTCKLK